MAAKKSAVHQINHPTIIGSDAQGGEAGEEEEEDRTRQAQDPVQPSVRELRPGLRPSSRPQRQLHIESFG